MCATTSITAHSAAAGRCRTCSSSRPATSWLMITGLARMDLRISWCRSIIFPPGKCLPPGSRVKCRPGIPGIWDTGNASSCAATAACRPQIGHRRFMTGLIWTMQVLKYLGRVFSECAEKGGQGLVGGGERVGQADLPQFPAGRRACPFEHPLRGRQRALGFLDEHGPRRGQLHRARCPVEELNAEHLLHRAHLLAERLLGDVELLGGTGEVALARNGDDIAHLP